MVLFNYSTKELTAKIVYYGPGLCGKTTNLQYIHANLPGTVKGKMLSLATKTDRTLFFDFLPLDLGTIRGMKTRIQLYTVPGQVFYNETRKLVLKGADGIVFVADSQETMSGANVEAFKNLEENLKAHGLNLSEMPHVIQFNKRDLPRLANVEELNATLNKYNAPFYESVATTGIGVQDTLKAITKLVLLHLTQKYDPASGKSSRPRPDAAPAAPAAPQAETPAPAPPSETGVPLSMPVAPPMAAAAAGTETVQIGMPLPLSGPPEEDSPVLPDLPPAPAEFTPPAEEEPVPDFGDSDIDELVEEVEEHEIGSEMTADPAESLEPLENLEPASSPDPALDLTGGQEPMEEPSDHPPASEWMPIPEPEPLGETPEFTLEADSFPEEIDLPAPDEPAFPAPDPVPQPPMEQAPPVPADTSSPFEVDRNFDPEYAGMPSLAPESPVEPAPEPSIESAPQEEEPALRLTQVAGNDSLFQDPNLEVVRLDAGTSTEVVIPVEIGNGTDRRRFKLSLHLRLDRND